jgi:hypothetical protein
MHAGADGEAKVGRPLPVQPGETEIFELEILGGPTERHFRARCPHVEKMLWGSLDLARFGEDELLAARRGWTDLALQEYAAAASQANVVRLLVRARAPMDLSALVANFPLDELVHTEVCARMAEELGGVVPIEYPTERVFPSSSPIRGSALAQAAQAVAWEFCVGETLSHGLLTFHHRHATVPLLEAAWGRLVKDEALHARFGWLFMQWALPRLTPAELRQVRYVAERAVDHVKELDEKVGGQPPEAFVDVGVFGSQGKEAYLLESRRILQDRVVRRLRSALGA